MSSSIANKKLAHQMFCEIFLFIKIPSFRIISFFEHPNSIRLIILAISNVQYPIKALSFITTISGGSGEAD